MAVTLGGLFNRNLLTKAVVYEKTDGRFSQSIEIGGCETYELCLTWSRGQFPEVWARAGALERCEDLDSIPHQFGFDEKSKSVKLCLQRQDWDSG